jgi:hypothetical protein
MQFYTNKQVKGLPKGRHIIVLLSNNSGQLVGLAQQIKSYNIKDNNKSSLSQYDFIVCGIVSGRDGEYLLPMGYSNEEEWTEQEFEYASSSSEAEVLIESIIENDDCL